MPCGGWKRWSVPQGLGGESWAERWVDSSFGAACSESTVTWSLFHLQVLILSSALLPVKHRRLHKSEPNCSPNHSAWAGTGRPGLDRAAFQTLLSFSLSTLLSIFLKSKGIIMLCLSLLHPAPSPAAKGNGNEHPTCLSFQLVTRLGYCLCFPLRDTDKKL